MLFVLAAPAQAGFFSDIIKFLAGTGVEASQISQSASVSLPLLGVSGPTPPGTGGLELTDGPALLATQDSALVAYRNPGSTLPSPVSFDQITVYTVQPGDTPGSIASSFGISLNTLLWANNIQSPNLVRVGDQLVILPVSGVKYEVKRGDTVASIAKRFRGDAGDILNFNGLSDDEPLEVGSTIIIPDGEFLSPPSVQRSPRERLSSLPEYAGYYLRPIFGGRRSRGIHGFNGVDLANSCGEAVLASAEGTVIVIRSSGWNGGYGKYLVISHPNGTQTLYAHLSSILATLGQHIARGSQVATIGSTGNSTGCHVHFETRGARNPF